MCLGKTIGDGYIQGCVYMRLYAPVRVYVCMYVILMLWSKVCLVVGLRRVDGFGALYSCVIMCLCVQKFKH